MQTQRSSQQAKAVHEPCWMLWQSAQPRATTMGKECCINLRRRQNRMLLLVLSFHLPSCRTLVAARMMSPGHTAGAHVSRQRRRMRPGIDYTHAGLAARYCEPRIARNHDLIVSAIYPRGIMADIRAQYRAGQQTRRVTYLMDRASLGGLLLVHLAGFQRCEPSHKRILIVSSETRSQETRMAFRE